MEMPFVSIIVPVYNAQSHLSRCLESICGQEYKNLELIVINDGSKDKSLPVCEEFRKKDSRILLVDKANSGVSDTRNLGLKLAGGKYVQFVDSDDYIAPDYTARLVEAAEKTGADLVISPYTGHPRRGVKAGTGAGKDPGRPRRHACCTPAGEPGIRFPARGRLRQGHLRPPPDG